MIANILRCLVVLVLIACVGSPPTVSAMWGGLPLDDVVRDSDFIVVGTLSDVYECSWAGWDYGDGTIAVKEVLWGDTQAGGQLRLRWDNPSTLACPRVEHAQEAGVERIWLLTRSIDESVRADHPCRSVTLTQRADVLRVLAGERKTVCLRSGERRYGSVNADVVTLVFRNPSGVPMTYPGVSVSAKGVTLDPKVRLTVCEGFNPVGEGFSPSAPGLAPKPGAIVVASDVAPLVVPPGEEVRLRIDVGALFELQPKTYTVSVNVEGYEPSNGVFIVLDPHDDFDVVDGPEGGRHSIALALVEFAAACLALVSFGIVSLRVSSAVVRVTVRGKVMRTALNLATGAAAFALADAVATLWRAIPHVW